MVGGLKLWIDRFTSLQYTKWIDKVIYIQTVMCIFSKFTNTFTDTNVSLIVRVAACGSIGPEHSPRVGVGPLLEQRARGRRVHTRPGCELVWQSYK